MSDGRVIDRAMFLRRLRKFAGVHSGGRAPDVRFVDGKQPPTLSESKSGRAVVVGMEWVITRVRLDVLDIAGRL